MTRLAASNDEPRKSPRASWQCRLRLLVGTGRRALRSRRNPSHQRARNPANGSMNPVTRGRTHHVEAIGQLAPERDQEFVSRIVDDASIEIEVPAMGVGQFYAGPQQQADRAEMRMVPVACGQKIVDVLVVPDKEHLGVYGTG